MPLVRIEILKGHASEYKRALMGAVHDALMNALGIPDWDRYQRLYELEEDHFDRGGGKTDKFVIVELTLFPGRSKAVKGEVIASITRLLGERVGIPPADVFIVIHDPPLENWGFCGVQKG